MSRLRRLAPWALGVAGLLLASPCQAQGNIDAGKSPAQIFADTCAACHRSARELRRAGASFLRQHYSTGSAEASAMANYLAGLPSEPKQDPRSAQPKRPPAAVGEPPAEAKQQPQPKQAPASPAEQARQAQAKGRRGAATAEVRPALAPAPVVEEKPPQPEKPPTPVLEPFEE